MVDRIVSAVGSKRGLSEINVIISLQLDSCWNGFFIILAVLLFVNVVVGSIETAVSGQPLAMLC